MNKGLNVCLMNDSFPPVIDGVANAVVNYGSNIAKNHGTATVVTLQYPGAVDDYPFEVLRYPSLNTEQLLGYRAGRPFYPATFGALENRGFDIIHTHCPVMSTLLARTMREELDIPVVFTYHTKFDINIADMVKSEIIQETALRSLVSNIRSCDEVWVVSEGAGENLRGIGYHGDYVVMENGVDFPKGRVTDEEAGAIRAKHGIGADEPVFMYVGRMMWYKGIGITLEGLRRAKERGCGFKIIFVGDGADRPDIELRARELGLEKDCIFAGAVQDRELLRAYFCAADLFLFSSTFDTNGIVVREAAACGLPSVLVKESCAAEGIANGKNAILIDENAGAMGDAVTAACKDRVMLKKLGQNAADSLYISWEQSVAKAVDRYGIVIDNYRKGSTKRDPIWTDPFFTVAADIGDKINEVHHRRVRIEEKGREIRAQAWAHLERYL